MGGPSSCESAFDKKIFCASGKTVTLYPALQADRPLIVLNTYTGDGESVMRELRKAGAENINLLVVGNLDWNHDMTPWDCPPLSKKDTPATGRSRSIPCAAPFGNTPAGEEAGLRQPAAHLHCRLLSGRTVCAVRHVPMRCLRPRGKHIRLALVSAFSRICNRARDTAQARQDISFPRRQGEKDKASAAENRAGQYGSHCEALPAAWD